MEEEVAPTPMSDPGKPLDGPTCRETKTWRSATGARRPSCLKNLPGILDLDEVEAWARNPCPYLCHDHDPSFQEMELKSGAASAGIEAGPREVVKWEPAAAAGRTQADEEQAVETLPEPEDEEECDSSHVHVLCQPDQTPEVVEATSLLACPSHEMELWERHPSYAVVKTREVGGWTLTELKRPALIQPQPHPQKSPSRGRGRRSSDGPVENHCRSPPRWTGGAAVSPSQKPGKTSRGEEETV